MNHFECDTGRFREKCIFLLLNEKRVGGLIGKGGASITRIRRESDAKIRIAKRIPNSLFRLCFIEGAIAEIIMAAQLITAKIAEESMSYHLSMLIEKKKIGRLIGKEGQIIERIRQDTDARIRIKASSFDELMQVVGIGGFKNSVNAAINMVINQLHDNDYVDHFTRNTLPIKQTSAVPALQLSNMHRIDPRRKAELRKGRMFTDFNQTNRNL